MVNYNNYIGMGMKTKPLVILRENQPIIGTKAFTKRTKLRTKETKEDKSIVRELVLNKYADVLIQHNNKIRKRHFPKWYSKEEEISQNENAVQENSILIKCYYEFKDRIHQHNSTELESCAFVSN